MTPKSKRDSKAMRSAFVLLLLLCTIMPSFSVVAKFNQTQIATSISISHMGDRLAVGYWDGSVHILNDARQVLREINSTNEEIISLRWSPNDQQLAIGTIASRLIIWDSTTDRISLNVRDTSMSTKPTFAGFSLAWHPNGHIIATGTIDGVLRLIDATNGDEIASQNYPSFNSIEWSPDGNVLTLGSFFGIRVISPTNLQSLAYLEITSAIRTNIISQDWSPSGQFLVTGNANGEIEIWNVDNNQNIKKFHTRNTDNPNHADAALEVAFIADETHVICITGGGMILSWNVQTDQMEQLANFNQIVTMAAFSHNSAKAVLFFETNTIEVFDIVLYPIQIPANIDTPSAAN